MEQPSKPIFYIATATSLVVIGDTLLYTILPSYYSRMGLAPYQVGLLLSVNRWVRLTTNHLSVYSYRRYPSELWLLGSFFFGAVVSAIYGTVNVFIVLLAARILWGLCYSFIRQAGIMTAVNAGDPIHLGKRMGFYRGVSSLWQGLGVFLGGLSHDAFGFSITLVAISIFSLSAIPLGDLSQKGLKQVSPSPLGVQLGGGDFGITVCGFSLGVVGSGLIMSTLGLVIKERIGESFYIFGYAIGVVTLTATILSSRWVIDAIFSPILGTAADSVGRERSIIFLFALGGLVMFSTTLSAGPIWLVFVVLLCFICGGTLYMLLSGRAGRHGIRSLASFVTAYDLGSSLGPSIGWSITQFGLPSHFIFVTAGTFYLLGAIASYGSLHKGRATL